MNAVISAYGLLVNIKLPQCKSSYYYGARHEKTLAHSILKICNSFRTVLSIKFLQYGEHLAEAKWYGTEVRDNSGADQRGANHVSAPGEDGVGLGCGIVERHKMAASYRGD